MFAAGARCARMTTPYATAPPETPARGAIVAEDSRFSITSQFCGRAILRPPRSAIWKFGLGCTAKIETAGMLAAPAGAAAVAGASGNTAPFFLFSAVHRPFFPPLSGFRFAPQSLRHLPTRRRQLRRALPAPAARMIYPAASRNVACTHAPFHEP